ncbi:hypothetical protein [Mycobacteroides chelonae]|uniref:hypothetical protein n=1 Tax=Mycobacteroides chelonae TaxID=1774 RepID=UPI0012FF6312|nr:hypothetical protein [Mycobacteroides chelonae]
MLDGKVKGTNMYADYTAREKILVEGLGDWVQLLGVHWYVEQEDLSAPLQLVQEKTINMIRSLVLDGLFELGEDPAGAEGFTASEDLEGTIREICKEYIDDFDTWGWQYHWCLNITPKGEQLAKPLMEAYRRELAAQRGDSEQ